MKKTIFTILCCMLFIVPVNAQVKDRLYYNLDDTINEKNEVNGSSILGGTNVTNESTVDGINIVGGTDVTDKSNSEYAIIAGDKVKVEGNYLKDALLAGNALSVNGIFNRDAFIFGSSISLQGTFGRDVTIYATTIDLNNVTIERNVRIYATNINIGKDVNIKGKLSYNEKAVVNGDIKKLNAVTYAQASTDTKTNNVTTSLVGLLCLLTLYAVIALLYPNIFRKLDENEFSFSNLFVYMGKGAFLLILGPILIVALFLTQIGIYLGALLAVLYILLIALSTLAAGYYTGHLVWNNLIKKESNILLEGLIGIIIIKLISIIPLLSVFIILLGMGLSLIYFKRK